MPLKSGHVFLYLMTTLMSTQENGEAQLRETSIFGQATENLKVLFASLLDDFWWQIWGRWGVVPSGCVEIVAHKLFVEAGWGLSWHHIVFRPEP